MTHRNLRGIRAVFDAVHLVNLEIAKPSVLRLRADQVIE